MPPCFTKIWLLDTKEYILSNWMAAKIRLRDRETVIGSSTECHVSHVLSSRMSSRPMGWSRTGCDKMSHLRAYYMNKGDMLDPSPKSYILSMR